MASTACSVFVRRETWPAETANTDWAKGKWDKYGARYTFQCENITVTAGFSYPPRIISWGPPLLPIIPHFHKYPTNIVLDLEIKSPSDTTRIDLTEIRLQVSDNKSVRLKKASAAKPDEISREIPIQKVAVSDGTTYWLRFNPFDSVPREFVLDLGSIQITDKNIKLPPLKCNKRFRYSYYPLYIDHLGEAIFGVEE